MRRYEIVYCLAEIFNGDTPYSFDRTQPQITQINADNFNSRGRTKIEETGFFHEILRRSDEIGEKTRFLATFSGST